MPEATSVPFSSSPMEGTDGPTARPPRLSIYSLKAVAARADSGKSLEFKLSKGSCLNSPYHLDFQLTDELYTRHFAGTYVRK